MRRHKKSLAELKQDTIDLLTKVDPPAIIDDTGEYLERPVGGWILSDTHFDGIGYYGTTMADYTCRWKPSKAGLGCIPPRGYG